jgi:hypothetical protein
MAGWGAVTLTFDIDDGASCVDAATGLVPCANSALPTVSASHSACVRWVSLALILALCVLFAFRFWQ